MKYFCCAAGLKIQWSWVMIKLMYIFLILFLVSCHQGIYVAEVITQKVSGNTSISMKICNDSRKPLKYSLLSYRTKEGLLPNRFYSISKDSTLIFNLSLSDVDSSCLVNSKDGVDRDIWVSYPIFKFKKNNCIVDSITLEGNKMFKTIKILYDGEGNISNSRDSVTYQKN